MSFSSVPFNFKMKIYFHVRMHKMITSHIAVAPRNQRNQRYELENVHQAIQHLWLLFVFILTGSIPNEKLHVFSD